MSSLGGQNLFGSGPHTIRPGSWQRSVQHRGFAGVNGELVLDMGLRSRLVLQDGRLQAASASALNTLISQIEQFVDGELHTLIDNYSHSYSPVFVEHFEPTTPIQRGRAFWCEYAIRYRQLP